MVLYACSVREEIKMKLLMYASYVYACLFIVFFIVATIVITIGGIFDLRFLFKSLRERELDEADDGRVPE